MSESSLRFFFLSFVVVPLCACEPPAAVVKPPRPSPPSSALAASAPASAAPAPVTAPPWKWREGEPARVIGDVPPVEAELRDVRWLSDHTLAIDTRGGPMVLWDVTTRAQRSQHEKRGGTGFAVDPRGRWVAVADTVFRLDETPIATFRIQGFDFWSSWDGERVIATKNGHIDVWPRSGGQVLGAYDDVDYVNHLTMLGDGRIPVGLATGNGLKLLDPASGKHVTGFSGTSMTDFFSPDGKRLFARDYDGKDMVEIDTATAAVLRTVPMPNAAHSRLSFSRDGGRVAFGEKGGCVVVGTEDGRVLGKVPALPSSSSMCYLSPDGTRVAGQVYKKGAVDTTVREFHVSTFGEKQETRTFSLEPSETVERAALAPDASALAVTYKSRDVRTTALWSLSPVRITQSSLLGRVAVGLGGTAAHAAPDGTLRLLDAATGNVTAELPKLPAEPRCLAIVGGHVVAGLADGRIALVSLATKALRFGSRALHFATGAADLFDFEPAPDGKRALVLARGAGDDFFKDQGHGVIAMLDVETGKVGAQTVLTEPAYFAAFDASGKRVATVSTHAVTVFEPGSPMVQKARHEGYMYPGKMRFSDDGTSILTSPHPSRNLDPRARSQGRIDLASGTATERPDSAPRAGSRVLGDRIALWDGDRVFLHRANGGEPLILRSFRDGDARHGVAYLAGGRFEAAAEALAHVPVCVGDPPSDWRCGSVAEMGAPAASALVAGWLAGK